MTIPVKHKGAISELTASAWLLSQGYEVFKNCSQHGCVDLVAYKDGLFILVDVKSGHPYTNKAGIKNYYPSLKLTKEQQDLGVKLLISDPETNHCFWA